MTRAKLDGRSLALRETIVRMMVAGGRGHLASALSLVEILRVLYDDVLRYRPHEPRWPDRDRFILSKGHGCMALYVMLAEKGFFPVAELDRFCRRDGILGGHPEVTVPGVEWSTGSLGHGLAAGVGFALHARRARTGARTFVVVGDGECNEGSVWEAALCASKHRLADLTVIVDCNQQQSYGRTSEVQNLEPFGDKWRAFGFSPHEIDGHDVEALRCLLPPPTASDRPRALICRTIKGRGIAHVEGNPAWHHKSKVTTEEAQALFHGLRNANA